MTVPATLSSVPNVAPYIQYVAAGGQTVYPYPFPITEDADLVVVINGTTQSTDSTYSVSGVGNSTGGNCTLNSGSNAGDIITLYRDIAIERISQIAQNSGFSSTVFNNEFNNFYLIAQQLEASISQCLQIPNTNNPAPTTTLSPSAYANKYLSFDAYGNPQPALLTVNGTLTAAAIASLLSVYTAMPILPGEVTTPAEIAAGVTPTNYAYSESDIRRYGALTTATDNHAIINTALSVSAAGGNAAFIPGGTWNITSPVTPTGSSSMYGTGEGSVIFSTGCDAIQFQPQASYAGSRFFRDFSLTGSSSTTSSYSGISFNMASGRVTGVQFSNLNIQNYKNMVYLTNANAGVGGLWNSAFRDCFGYNCYNGYYLNGECIQLLIDGGFVQLGNMTGTGTRYGVYTGLSAGSGNVQALTLHAHDNYSYDIGCELNYTVEAVVDSCGFSLYNTNGVQIATINGGPTVVRDCWIQSNPTANSTVGIYIIDRGSAANDKIVIDGNEIQGSSGTGTMGVYCGENQTGITLTSNTIGTSAFPLVYGIAGLGGTPYAESPNLVAKYNTIYATTTAIAIGSACTNADVGPNIIQSGTPLTFIAGTPTGFRYTCPGMRGTASFSTATTVAVTFTTAMPNSAYSVLLGGNAAGYCWPTSKGTGGFTINCSASNSNATDWAVTYG